VALVDDDQVKKVRAKLLVNISFFFGAGHRLIKRQVDLVGFIGLTFLDFGHGRAERLEVVGHGLIDQNVAVGEKQDASRCLGLPKPPNDLKGGEGLAGAGGHDQQNAVLAAGNCLDSSVDGQQLVIAWTLIAAVAVVILSDKGFLLVVQATVRRPPLPQCFCCGKFVKCELPLNDAVCGDLVVEQEAIAIGAEHKRDLQHLSIAQRLLHTIADGVIIVLGFDDGDWDVRLIEKDIIDTFVLGSGMELAANDDASFGEGKFFSDLG